MYTKEKEICPAYILNHNSVREKQIIHLMIANKEEEGWRYIAVKNLSALLRGITSKYHGDFCLDYLYSFRTENKLKSHKKVCKKYCSTTKIGDHILCGYSMWTIWGFNHIEDKHTLHRGKDCMKRICESLIERAKSIIDFEKKECYH